MPKLKVGYKIKKLVKCQYTLREFTVSITVKQANDTQYLLQWKADNWYKNLDENAKKGIAYKILEKEKQRNTYILAYAAEFLDKPDGIDIIELFKQLK